MKSRERVLTALNHKEPDRVPIDFGGMRSTGISAIAYNKLRKALGLKNGNAKLYDVFQQLADIDVDVLQKLSADVVQVHRLCPAFGIKIKEWKEGILPDGSKCLEPKDFNPVKRADGAHELKTADGKVIAVRTDGGLYYNPAFFPLANMESEKDVDDFSWEVMGKEEEDFIRAQAKYWCEKTDYAVMGSFGGNILEQGHALCGYEKFMLDIAMRPELVEYLLDKVAENHIANLERYLKASGDYIQIIVVGDDLGTQYGMQLSLDMYRKMIKPRQAKVYDYIKKHSKAILFLHSCGAISELLPDLIEIGIQVINPVQTNAAGMDPVILKKKFGRNLSFWGGGVDTQKTLPFGTIADIVKQAKERIKIFAPGGGFVFNQIHNVQADIPPEKVIAMYNAAKENGKYPVE